MINTVPVPDHEQRVEDALQALMPFFHSVQIVAVAIDGDSTITIPRGDGCHHTRYGAVREWMIKEEELMRIAARREAERAA